MIGAVERVLLVVENCEVLDVDDGRAILKGGTRRHLWVVWVLVLVEQRRHHYLGALDGSVVVGHVMQHEPHLVLAYDRRLVDDDVVGTGLARPEDGQNARGRLVFRVGGKALDAGRHQ